MATNDNESVIRGSTNLSFDDHGRAALLLVESLIHELCEKMTLSTAEAIEITERAVSVQFDRAEAADGAGAPMWRSHALLLSIAASLRTDSEGHPPPRLVP